MPNVNELDITDFFNSCEPKYYSASAAELGQNAGRITWENAVDRSEESTILNSEEQREQFRKFVRSSGGWTDEEIAKWTDVELNALCIQWISGDMRESGLHSNMTAADWEEYEEKANRCQCSGNIYGGPLTVDGRVYFSIDA